MNASTNKARHNVYVIALDPEVTSKKIFQRQNPEYQPGRECLYVGMTGRSPELRFEQHKAGYKASRSVKNFGLRLCPKLFAHLNPMTHDDACEREVTLAESLRKIGYGVVQN